MGMFDQMKDLYKMQAQAKQIKKELSNIHIEAAEKLANNGTDYEVVVTVTAEMEIVSVVIPAELMEPHLAAKVGEAVTKAAGKAIKKAQEVAAEKMKGMMGDLGGLLGGGQG